MQALGAAAIGLLVAMSIVVALRLLGLHRRSGSAPELMLGLMLLLAVGVGYPLMIAASRAGPESLAIRPLLVASALGTNLGFALLWLFTRHVFRRDATWAALLAGAGILALLYSAGLRCFEAVSTAEPRLETRFSMQSIWQLLSVVAAYTWTSWESLRYHVLMRRRVRLGLADPVVCDRFLLWGLMSLAVSAGVLLNGFAIWRGVSVFQTPGILLASSATGLAQAVLLLLAFLPPARYLAWVRTRARAMEA
jgi:hypothetical protein